MINYEFRDLSQYTNEELEKQITEGFKFGDYDTTENDLFLISRDAPTPDSKEIVESVPYMQGVYDFSVLNFDRYFENREITYQLMMFGYDYSKRKIVEQELKRRLMPLGNQSLYDTHDYGYHWLGKVKNITVEDDADKNVLTANITFDCYPFAILNNPATADVWDDVYFPRWVFQETKYINTDYKKKVKLYNLGSTSVVPKIIASTNMKIVGQTNTITVHGGINENVQLALEVGENILWLIGNGEVEFQFNREEMI